MVAPLAPALWNAWAVVVWNVVFDFVVVAAGREVVHAAGVAPANALNPVNIDAFMRPAVTQGLWMATLAASAIVLVGLSSVHVRRSR
jgi:hypothetical protein